MFVLAWHVLPMCVQEAERKFEELRARRKDHVRAVLMSQNFLLGVLRVEIFSCCQARHSSV